MAHQVAASKVSTDNRGPNVGERRSWHCFICGENHRLVSCQIFKYDTVRVEENEFCETCLNMENMESNRSIHHNTVVGLGEFLVIKTSFKERNI